MKYIRTKDGRILKIFCENISMFEENDGCSYYGENTIDFETSLFMPKSEIIKQADTIEELCDMFIVKHNYETIAPYEIVDCLKPILNGMKVYIEEFKKSDVYGAIWTDEGLIYVAKMNEKGELELL